MKLKKDELDLLILGRAAAALLSRLSHQRIEFKPRWITAVAKAVAELEQNDYWYFDGEELFIFSATTAGVMYVATPDVCQCTAFNEGFPCYHRAAATLIRTLVEQPGNGKLKQTPSKTIETSGRGDEEDKRQNKAEYTFFNSRHCSFFMSSGTRFSH